jgi:hypothetical protein
VQHDRRVNSVAATVQDDGCGLALTLNGVGFAEQFHISTETLGTLVSELFKIWGVCRTSAVLETRSPGDPPMTMPTEVFHARKVDVVVTSAGSATLRIYPPGGAAIDVVFHRAQLEFALATILATNTPQEFVSNDVWLARHR